MCVKNRQHCVIQWTEVNSTRNQYYMLSACHLSRPLLLHTAQQTFFFKRLVSKQLNEHIFINVIMQVMGHQDYLVEAWWRWQDGVGITTTRNVALRRLQREISVLPIWAAVPLLRLKFFWNTDLPSVCMYSTRWLFFFVFVFFVTCLFQRSTHYISAAWDPCTFSLE